MKSISGNTISLKTSALYLANCMECVQYPLMTTQRSTTPRNNGGVDMNKYINTLRHRMHTYLMLKQVVHIISTEF
jgi:hypothetical protein